MLGPEKEFASAVELVIYSVSQLVRETCSAHKLGVLLDK